MKKIISLMAILLVMMLVITACGSDNHTGENNTPTGLPETDSTHIHTYTMQQDVEKTCIEAAHTVYICECGYTEKDYWAGIDDLAEHEWDWETYTCLSPVKCSVCGMTDGIPREHEYHDIVTPPTCTQKGFTTHICICENPACTCRDSYISDEVSPLGHTWEEFSCSIEEICSRCGEIKLATEHDWIPGTCTVSTQCSKCQESLADNYGHSWEGGSCEEKSVCKICGEIGDYIHDWHYATCSSPKWCYKCPAIEGEPLGHNFVKGFCLNCGEPES